MKKITKFLAIAAVAAMPFAFTSCDDDYDYYYDDPWWYGYNDGGWGWNDGYYDDDYDYDDEDQRVEMADVLAGEWEGSMSYFTAADGTTDNFNVNWTFSRNDANAIKGTGTELDYLVDENNNITDSQTLKFEWYIDDNGDIHIRYNGGNEYVMDSSAKERGFKLSDSQFDGYMLGTNNKDMVYFETDRVTSNAKAAPGVKTKKSNTIFGSTTIEKLYAPNAQKKLPRR